MTFQPIDGGFAAHRGPLTLEVTAPAEGAIAVRIYRFIGLADHRPALDLRSGAVSPVVEIKPTAASLTSGALRAAIEGETLSFTCEGRELTRSLGPVHDGDAIRERLHIAPGETFGGLGAPHPLYGRHIDRCDAPLCVSGRGYALFATHTGHTAWDVGLADPAALSLSARGEELCYILLAGPPEAAFARCEALLSRRARPAPRSLLPWRDAAAAGDAAHLQNMAMAGLYLPEYNYTRESLARIAERARGCRLHGLSLCVGVSPLIPQRAPAFGEALRAGHFIRRADGEPLFFEADQGCASPLDLTLPAARDFLAEKLRELLGVGVDSLDALAIPALPADALYADGSDPAAMQNHYAAQFEALLAALLKEGSPLFTRAPRLAGRGSVAIATGAPSYDGLAQALYRCLSLAQSGASATIEVPEGLSGDSETCWHALALLCPHPRLRGIPPSVERLMKLRARLMPYLLSQSAGRSALPLMRPLSMAFPGERGCEGVVTQFMLGGDLLAIPALEEGDAREFYLPDLGGPWTDLHADRPMAGGRWLRARCPIFLPPLFARPGSLIPFAAPRNKRESPFALPGTDLRLYALPDGETARCALFNDAGQPVAQAAAERRGNALRLALSEQLTGVTFALMNLHKAPQIKGGSIASAAYGLRVTPSGKEVILQIEG